ncbi:hypothetical protein [Desulfofundulus thermocisternus]|uniref:hypothetical protein n=1 Tax=Desulfofundulus thermocisternus TaxID=42471 RepID=UPI00217CF65D|nr:hypothetical protein [Desulfofundulus thermocisternus]MCS5695061.1 hypothetical protein [Desulfofundulus thermocisternus]
MMNEGLKTAFSYPLVRAILSRRSRRFGLGMEIDQGPLAYKSEKVPVPLSEEEEAFLVWMGTGIKSKNISDIPPHLGLDLEVQFTSRANPSLGDLHRTEIFYTNDEGTFMVKLHDILPEDFAGLEAREPRECWEAILELFRRARVRLEDGRAQIPDKPPGMASHNLWNVNKPGTTVFFPITDLTAGVLDLLFFYVRPSHRYNFVDEWHNNRPAGTERWIKEGYIREEMRMPLIDSEIRFANGYIGEQAMICQNFFLAAQAMGLGGFLFSGFSGVFLLGGTPFYRGLGFRFVMSEKHIQPLPVGRDGVFEAFCPPYYRSMDEAVDAFVEMKWSRWKDPKYLPYRQPEKIQAAVPPPSEREIQIVKDIANYIYNTYGRFPAVMDPMYARFAFQAHHLDCDFYDRHYPPGAYTDLHARHMELWHAARGDGS